MTWLWIIIFAFLFLAIAALFDRYFLAGPIAHPELYTFYLGILTFLFSFLFIPVLFYFNINIWNKEIISLGICTGIARIIAVLFMNQGVHKSEVSRVVPAIGGLVPIFSFLLFYLYSPQENLKNVFFIFAILLLAIGSFLIATNRIKGVFSTKNLKYSVFSAFFFAFTFFLAKNLFSATNFLQGLYLVCIGSGIAVFPFIISKKFRKELYSKKISVEISRFFIFGQIFGALGVLAQFYAIYLASVSQVPLINALEGLKYVFLFILIFILSIWNPKILKETFSGESTKLKVFAVILICAGIALLYLA